MAYNEPAGSSLVFETAFNNFTGLIDSYNTQAVGTLAIVADATAPFSPSNCMRSQIFAGATGGGTQLDLYTATYDDMYVRFWWRTNSQFQGLTVGNKMFFVRGLGMNGVFKFGGDRLSSGQAPMIFVFNTSGVNNQHILGTDDPGWPLYPNVSAGTLTVGIWHMIEAYIHKSTTLTSQDGILRWWVNGTLAGNYPNINYAPNGLDNWTWSEAWDGSIHPPPAVAWQHFIDHLYISSGGSVVPPATTPTISSFTPTSGPVGTPITITGTNFDPNPAGNVITLNNIACQTLGAVPTQLNTAVPNNGTSGQIKVVTSAGTALSGTNFTVTIPEPGGGEGGGGGGGAGTTTGVFTTDFSGVQGPRWYYLNGDGTQMTYSSTSQLWNGAQLYQGIWNGGFHPGTSSAAVLKYVVPGTGSVRITGAATDLDTGGGDGVVFVIKKNGSTTLFTRTMDNGDTTGGAYDITNSVTDGDYFTFEVTARAHNVYDSTNLNPTIVYTPQSQPEEVITLTLSSISVTEGESGAITLTLTPTRATDSLITLSSSSSSAVIAGSTTIPANTGSVLVQVLAGPPGSAVITATLGTATTTSTVTSIAAPDPEIPVPPSPTLSAYTDFLLTYRLF